MILGIPVQSASPNRRTPCLPMASATRATLCHLQPPNPAPQKTESAAPVQIPRATERENSKIVLQPRLCTLRSYGSDRNAVVVARRDGDGGGEGTLKFFETLSEYIESSKKSHDFEIISGRLAMIVFAATVATETVTGSSLFKKMDEAGLEEGLWACLGAMACAAVFAWLSSNRSRVGRMFTVSCNAVIDSLIDRIVDGLFYESELSEWSDEA